MTETIERPRRDRGPVPRGLLRAARRGRRRSGDGNTLDGYGAVFGSARPGSTRGRALRRGDRPRRVQEVALRADPGAAVRPRPPPDGRLDPAGLLRDAPRGRQGPVRQRPLHDNWLVQPVRDAIKSKAIPGMSFRFSVVKDEWRTRPARCSPPGRERAAALGGHPDDPSTILKRTLLEVKLYEVGPVVFPAYADTSVGVRSREILTAAHRPPGPRRACARPGWHSIRVERSRRGFR
jgi:hypothetical protein